MITIAYIGNQIKPECKGDLAVAIAYSFGKDRRAIFDYPIDSEEMKQILSIQYWNNPLERIYWGINSESAKKIATKVAIRDFYEIWDIDKIVARPELIRKNKERLEEFVDNYQKLFEFTGRSPKENAISIRLESMKRVFEIADKMPFKSDENFKEKLSNLEKSIKIAEGK